MATEIDIPGGPIPDRSSFSPTDIVQDIWTTLGLPTEALDSLQLEASSPLYASSFKISHLAQSSIALSALGAALMHSVRTGSTIPKVAVPLRQACLEFKSEGHFTINGKPMPSAWGPIGGLHKTADGYVRIHDNFANHRNGALKLLGLNEHATREDVAAQVAKWQKVKLEDEGHANKLALYALRSYQEWDALPQSTALSNFPIHIRKISDSGSKGLPQTLPANSDRCLRGLRVLELTRVIAGPVCGKALAVHGADVFWVTSPSLPDLPSLDRNLSRGKQSIQLDLNDTSSREVLRVLVKNCDVFIQSYRPGALSARGLGPADLAALKPGLIYANLSAFGPTGPWRGRRGFDSLVQTATGMNVSEAEHYGDGAAARPMPAQALDHGGGFLLATGIMAALHKRAAEGGSWEVNVSLAGVMKYLRSLGQWEEGEGFQHADPAPLDCPLPDNYFEESDSPYGRIRGLKHTASVEGFGAWL